jgi:hypothetical protein
MRKEHSLEYRLTELKGRGTLQLTTRGRKTGKRHTVTTWFLVEGQTLYVVTMSMRRDWPRNIGKNGYAEVQIDGTVLKGHATQIRDAKRMERVNELLRQKYWVAWLGSWFGLGPDGAFAVTIED